MKKKSTGQNENNKSLLEPYQILDLTDEKGILCSKILADLGANVINIEKPGGNTARSIGPYYHDIADSSKSLFWFAFNTNRKSLTLDIETLEGQEILKKLVKSSDALIESFNPGYLADLGLSYEKLSAINPKLVMTSITPFGQSGPYANLKGPDLVVWAMGLAMAQCGTLDRAPVQVSFPQAFMHAGADGAEGTMVALYHAQITGEGQHVDVAAMESVIWSVVEVIPEWDLLKYNSKRPGSSLVRPSGKHAQIIWECQDGYVCYIINGGQLGAKTNRGLVDWMGQEAMAPLFMKNIDWDRWGWDEITQEELDSIAESVARFFKCHTKGEILDEAVKRNMQIVPIYDSKDTLASTQLRARQFWVDINHAELADNITYPGAFAQFSETPIRIRHRAPLIGEHNEEIYIEKLGMTIEEISTLKSRGVI